MLALHCSLQVMQRFRALIAPNITPTADKYTRILTALLGSSSEALKLFNSWLPKNVSWQTNTFMAVILHKDAEIVFVQTFQKYFGAAVGLKTVISRLEGSGKSFKNEFRELSFQLFLDILPIVHVPAADAQHSMAHTGPLCSQP